MSGGGGKHRAPIEMPPDTSVKATAPGRGRGKTAPEPFEIDRDSADLRPPDGDGSAYRASMRSAVVHHIVTAFLVAMVLGIGTWGYLTFKNAPMSEPGSFSLQTPPFEAPAGNAQVDRFRFALDVYFRIYDKYPPDLDILVEEGLLAWSDLSHPPGNSSITYERRGDSYELTIERTTVTIAAEGSDAGANGSADAGSPAQTNGSQAEDDAGTPEP